VLDGAAGIPKFCPLNGRRMVFDNLRLKKNSSVLAIVGLVALTGAAGPNQSKRCEL
jgi:hypothetical protein